jgi:Skp family chaperone for outer membrane proteins
MTIRRPHLHYWIAGLLAANAASFPAGAEDGAVSGAPAIPGICVLSKEAVFDGSKVGQDVTAQYRAARDAAQQEVNDQEAKIASGIKALEDEKASLPEDRYQQRQQELAKRLQDLRADAARASQDLEATRAAVVKQIAKAVQPFIASVYRVNRCALLLSRDAVLAGNPGMDVTGEVIKGLDGKITTMTFARDKDDK